MGHCSVFLSRSENLAAPKFVLKGLKCKSRLCLVLSLRLRLTRAELFQLASPTGWCWSSGKHDYNILHKCLTVCFPVDPLLKNTILKVIKALLR